MGIEIKGITRVNLKIYSVGGPITKFKHDELVFAIKELVNSHGLIMEGNTSFLEETVTDYEPKEKNQISYIHWAKCE